MGEKDAEIEVLSKEDSGNLVITLNYSNVPVIKFTFSPTINYGIFQVIQTELIDLIRDSSDYLSNGKYSLLTSILTGIKDSYQRLFHPYSLKPFLKYGSIETEILDSEMNREYDESFFTNFLSGINVQISRSSQNTLIFKFPSTITLEN